MLGQQLYEGSGKETGRRILPNEGSGPRMEASFRETGKMLGVEVDNSGTYTAVGRPDGSLYGTGQGIAMSKEGDVITWTGSGIGHFLPNGSIAYRGALYFQTASQKLARLNGVVGVYEYEIEANGTQKGKIFEWK